MRHRVQVTLKVLALPACDTAQHTAKPGFLHCLGDPPGVLCGPPGPGWATGRSRALGRGGEGVQGGAGLVLVGGGLEVDPEVAGRCERLPAHVAMVLFLSNRIGILLCHCNGARRRHKTGNPVQMPL